VGGHGEGAAYLERLEAVARMWSGWKPECMQGAERCRASTLDGQSPQSTLWRGWYFGREAFHDWLLEKADAALGAHRRRRKNDHGPEALRLIAAGLKEAKLTPEKLRDLAKSDVRKTRIARAVRNQTTARHRSGTERSAMEAP
jgi:hypothetical protein